ncbi:hypothetical protein BR93DRAFT_939381 [Coniochaeta sp. PMI_546]|nr:hypothetical protein BR93DRAFT_939381 [Coniochaeta sp. PMI_546]
MAPSTSLDGLNGLVARYVGSCPSGTYYSNGYCYRNSGWYFWGRWLFAGIVIAFVIGAIVLLGCINSRRRRRQGLAPRYGTGWMAPAPKYSPNSGGYVPPPPQYTSTPMQNYPPPGQQQQPQYTGQTFNSNDGYYGGHNEGVAPPPNTYYPQRGVGGENVYEPPAGPPPGKHA